MKAHNVIDLRELQLVINRLLNHIIEEKRIAKVELVKDYYWNIPTSELYAVASDPKHLDVGSLFDDWGFVRGLTNQGETPVAMQLAEVAPILRYIGNVVGEA